MVDTLLCPLLLRGTVRKSSRHERWSTARFCASHSCVRWQPFHLSVDWASRTNNLVSAKSRSFFVWFSLWVGPKRKSEDQNQEHVTRWKKKFTVLLTLFVLISQAVRAEFWGVWRNLVEGFKFVQELKQCTFKFRTCNHLSLFTYYNHCT